MYVYVLSEDWGGGWAPLFAPLLVSSVSFSNKWFCQNQYSLHYGVTVK